MTLYELLELRARSNDAARVAKEALTLLQTQCDHPGEYFKATYESDTGNFSSTDDSWWVECSCSLCGRRWAHDSAKEPQLYLTPRARP